MNAETKICKQCGGRFEITADEKALYEKIGIPVPGECFKCRMQHLFAFWMFGKFRKGKSSLSGKDLITILPEKTRYPVYTSHEWFSDEWDPMDYGQKYDSNRSFFKQFKELQERVPRPHQTGKNNLSCDWCDDVWDSKNCYLTRAIIGCENLSYSYRNVNVKDSFDVTYCYNTDKSYDITFCFNCHKLKYSLNSRDCLNSSFLFDCRNVQDSFMCWNLRNRQYYFFNEPYSKDEYLKKIKAFNLGSRKIIEELKTKFNEIIRDKAVHRANFNVRSENSIGNYLTNCNRCHNLFHWEDSENCYNSMRGFKTKNCIDLAGSGEAELCGMGAMVFIGGYKTNFSSWTNSCTDSEYLDSCMECRECFGCVGVRKKKNCILNKQYSEEEYKRLKAQIIEDMKLGGEYGEFFPYSLAYGGYNLTTAQIYFPKTKETVISMGGTWDEAEDKTADGISPEKLPDDIADVENGITGQALICPKTGYRFNIASHELSFYKEMNIPLPRLHPDYRNIERFKLLTVIDAYPYKCTFCGADVGAYYLPEWGYKRIACIKCYQKEIA
ncbi:hypothetical protein A2116_00075 [Candidatus Jorgensenbacteria bacterium GWA1_49_17]|uniref:Uncharacterized protein n=2 Tax=Candidatus Joergenseniibacteriota TaxID=1752739 RepID=A0A1F6BMK3_9BACT|nr:MAG: hypothetical protein A2127_02595 [Candidatus Jorgensenbacteria bacterium GWC1_48_12]OGG39916.1 MAG: hypothetical protein A2116_00075 [Candidatus Jorgensenbacteria bacterium GWA1_49_17]